jgi:hypothetical protein
MESSRTAKGRVRRPFARLVGIGVAAAMAIALLPGVAAAVAYPNVTVVPSTTTAVPGQAVKFQAANFTAALTSTDVTHASDMTWTMSGPAAGSCVTGTGANAAYEICTPTAIGLWVVIATQTGPPLLTGVATIVVSAPVPGAVVSFDVNMSAHFGTPVKNAPYSETLGVADTVKVCAVDAIDLTVPGYTGTVRFTSSDPLAVLPADYTFTAADAGCHTFSVTFGSMFNQSLTVNDTLTPLGFATAIWGSTMVDVSLNNSFLYQPLAAPVRLLDTRSGNGLSGVFTANTPRAFLIAGRGGIPWCAKAVTGNLTVTDETSGWAVYLGPDPQAAPTSSSINFTKGQVVANSLTVALSATGYLNATYISTAGQTTNLVFDATGYYGCADSDLYFHALTPTRVLDTRNNNGFAGKLTANMPVTFPVADVGGVPHSAVAVTGNLTVTGASSGWAIYLGATAQAAPTSSTLNFVTGQVLANGVTVGLGHDGTLSATFISTPGNTTDLVFDVTGYYNNNRHDDGMEFVPVAPVRILDTRVGGSPLQANAPLPFQVTGVHAIPLEAGAVTGNVTVTDETSGWALYVGPFPVAAPTTSNINFVKGDIRANGMTAGVHQHYPWPAGENGFLNATYVSNAGNTTNMVFDLTGYFVETDLVTKVTPTLITVPSPAVSVGNNIWDTVNFFGANNPTGTVIFHLYGPANPTCIGAGSTDSQTVHDGLSATSSTFVATAPGTYHWIAEYLGDVNNNAVMTACGEPVTIWAMANPSLSTVPSPASGPIGTVLNDTATLTGGSSPTGTIVFALYLGTCTPAHLLLAQAATVSSAAASTSIGYTTTVVGTYHWAAYYSGDAHNNSDVTGCGEPVVIAHTPTIVTNASAGGSIGAAITVTDTATLTGAFGTPTGNVVFDLYGPLDTTCAATPIAHYATNTLVAGVVTSPAFAPTLITAGAGTYHWIARYSGDANYIPLNSACSVEPVVIVP